AANSPMSTGNAAPSYNQSDKYSKSEMLPDLESQPSITGSEVTETAGGSGDIKSTIATYARKAGIDPSMATTFAAMESSLNPNAKASTSSAAGPFQFINSTWRSMLSKYGKKYGLDSNASPFDVKASTLMASEFIKENINGLKKVVSNPNIVHAYLAHFLGLGGARTFLKMGPNDIPARTMQAAARANRSIFFDKSGRPRTAAQIYEVMKNKVTKAAKDFGISLPSISGTPTASNDSNYSGQGAANDPVASSSSLVSFGDAGSMLGGQPSPTAPSASSSMKGLLSPQNTNPIGTYDGSGVGYSPDSGGSSLDTVATAMNKSVDIQTQMLAVLQDIAGKINPENFNDLKGMIDKAVTGGGMQEVSGKVNQAARSASTSFNSIVDLARKTA
ncbi:MAG: transglycosylase SLT domain-containing protein, partial [Ottowia sp.]|nr:transglycosylase SLT domain-containing protein [Ottowia sp.]